MASIILKTRFYIFRNIGFWFMTMVLLLAFAQSVFAQNQERIKGYVIDFVTKKPIGKAKIKIFKETRESYSNGEFVVDIAPESDIKEADVSAEYKTKSQNKVKKEIKYDKKEKTLTVYMHDSKYFLKGIVKSLDKAKSSKVIIEFAGIKELTNDKGEFEFKLSPDVKVNQMSKFKVDGEIAKIQDISDNFVELFAGEAKIEPMHTEYSITIFEGLKPLSNKKIIINGKEHITDSEGKIKHAHPKEEAPLKTANISLKGYTISAQNFDKPDKSSITLKKNNAQEVITEEVITETTEESVTESDTSEYTYSADFNHIINELELEKQNLSQRGALILSEIEEINGKLNNHEGEISENEKTRLKRDLERLVNALVANEVAYEDAQEKTKKVVDKMTNLVSEKDSLQAKVHEVEVEVENTKNFALAELVIFSLTSLILIAIAIVYYFVARNIKKQKEEIEKAYKNIEGINEIGQKIAATLDFDGLAMTVHENVAALMDANVFGVGAYNAREHRLEFRRFIDSGEMIPYLEENLNNENKFSVWCFKNQKPVIINDLSIDYKKYLKVKKYEVAEGMPLSLIYLPLISDNQPKGVVTVQSFQKNAYSEQSLTILETLASYISIALENTQSYKIIQDRNKNITDSIRYAKTIQQAILPTENAMRECLNDYFTIFIPKDIVSGDFYWFSQISENKYFLAVVDCTGHGVPGAFMSMIGNAFLNEIVNTNDVHNPAQVLENLNISVRNVLKQDEKTNDDGMDACLCMVEKMNKKENKVLFSGAKRPLYFVRSLTKELQTLKGDSKSVGGFTLSIQPFTCQELMLNSNDMIYLTSDGMIDQSGNEKQKFGTPRLQNILKESANLPASIQKEKLLQALKDHQKDSEQRDDITLLGIKM